MNVVLDTNILVSALLSPFGKPARVLDLVLIGEVQLVFDDRILLEYLDVLKRPRFGFDHQDVAALIQSFMAEHTSITSPPLALALPDPDDLPFLEVAAAANAVLVTGNLQHYPESQRQGVQVYAPAIFLEWWQNRDPV